MQIKNRLFFIILVFLFLFKSSLYLKAEEFDISAEEIIIDKEKNIVTGKGSVVAKDQDGRTIKADKIIYKKNNEELVAEGNVEVLDLDDNILTTDKAIYDKINEIVNTYQNSNLILKEGYTVSTNKIIYNNLKKIITSNQSSILTDTDGNIAKVDMFQHNIQKNIFSSVGKIEVLDINKNKYFFKELYVDTKKKEMIGSDVSAVFDQDNFGVSKENDPRFAANQIFITKNKTDLLKGIFTVCHQEKDKCPPWSIKAKKISHDKIKKTIYYEHAVLKVYDIPVFYFPKFLHPDPTVKRQSGFLFPFFTNTSSLGAGFGIPYYWAINKDKDLTFTPKVYSNEHSLFMNEYRQAFKSGFLTLDTSYTEGYKNITSTKTDGSRNHVFGQLDIILNQDESYESNMSLKVQRTSNDVFFRVHDVNSSLVKSENTNLENVFNYNYNKNNMFFNASAAVYENLREKTNNRYEYILPNIMYGKTFFTEKYGSFDFISNALYKNYDSDKHLSFLNNDLIWTSNNATTKKGVVNSFGGMITNMNYEAKNTQDYKTKGIINELKSVLTYKSSLPMKKDNINSFNIFSPSFMLRYAPGHMRDLGDDSLTLKHTNLFAMNKTSEIENGLSAVLGFDFKKSDKNADGTDREKYTLSIGQVFRTENNHDIPSKSSLDQKMSDMVGELNYNFLKVGNLNYKFSVDHNINEINYSEISSNFNFGKVDFNLDYLEERNHVGEENYINAGINLNLNRNNKLTLGTKKNFRTESTEFYDISYQYINDCLTAGLVYRREFYEDTEVEQKDTLMFQITFVPFGGVKTPTFINP
jgi:LPS-assembly protein